MLAEQMIPIERMTAYNNGDQVDRLPCVPIVGNTAARVIGVKVSEFKGNGKLIAKAQVEAYKLFKYDIIRIFTDLYTQAEAMGAKIHYPFDETAYHEAPAINDISQIDQLQPADPYKDGNLPHHLEAMKIAVDEVGQEAVVTGAVTGPFTNASILIGTELLIKLTLKDPSIVHKLCEVSLATSLNYVKAIIDAGCTPSLTDAMSSCAIIGPKQFKEFSFPYLKRLIDYIHSRDKKVTLHICGNTRPVWELMAMTGADCLSIDTDADLLEAKRMIGDKVRLMGNVRPSETMLMGTPADVRRETVECIMKCFDNPKGYIVASGCSLPTETPFENIHAMLDTVRTVGYPIDTEKLHRLSNNADKVPYEVMT